MTGARIIAKVVPFGQATHVPKLNMGMSGIASIIAPLVSTSETEEQQFVSEISADVRSRSGEP